MVERFNIEITGRSALWQITGQCFFVLAIIKRDGDSDLAEESIKPITDNIFSSRKRLVCVCFFWHFRSKDTRPRT